LKELFTIENKLFVEKSLCDINLKWRKSISEQLFDIHETSTYIIIRNKKKPKEMSKLHDFSGQTMQKYKNVNINLNVIFNKFLEQNNMIFNRITILK